MRDSIRRLFDLRYWRYAMVIFLVLGAVITPTSDVFNMLLIAAPLGVLYFLGAAALHRE